MKHNELRSGNIINRHFENGEGEQTEITVRDIFDCKRAELEPDFKFSFTGIELTPEWLDRFGFEKLPHFTVSDSRHIELRTDKFLSIGCAGTPNEMAFIQEFKGKECTDLVCVHNYDFDGPMTVHKLQNLFFSLTGRELELKKHG